MSCSFRKDAGQGPLASQNVAQKRAYCKNRCVAVNNAAEERRVLLSYPAGVFCRNSDHKEYNDDKLPPILFVVIYTGARLLRKLQTSPLMPDFSFGPPHGEAATLLNVSDMKRYFSTRFFFCKFRSDINSERIARVTGL